MDTVIIDVRQPPEYANSHVAGSINMTASQMQKGSKLLQKISKQANIVVYCRSGARSALAKNILQNLGYENVTNGINQSHVEAMTI